jgi:hypothetical protein
MPTFDTVANIVSNAGIELGLLDDAIAAPLGSEDQNVIQLCALLNRVGKMLVRGHAWSHLTEEHTFNTAGGTESYALPAGFGRFRHATWWNRNTTMPLGGPLSPAQWQMVKASSAAGAGAIVRPFRVRENLLYLYPTPTAAEAIYFEYVSKYWVGLTGAASPTLEAATADTDVLWLDEPLLVAGLKLAFKRAKSQDTSYAQAEFDEIYASVAGSDGAARTINITSSGGFLLGDGNIPDTGYGS